MRSLLDLYRNGNGMETYVWEQLMAKGELQEGTAEWSEAHTVAVETMGRVRQNVSMIVEHLAGQKYIFGMDLENGNNPAQVWVAPEPNTSEMLRRLTQLVGPIPMSLRTWWEVVGSVSLQGTFSDLADEGLPMSDPLMVPPLSQVLAEAEDPVDEDVVSALDLAPDIYHKADVSGGLPYQIEVPNSRADGALRNVRIFLPCPPGSKLDYKELETNESFIEYLRRSFMWAGFPGLAFVDNEPMVEHLRPIFARMLPL
ncbi:MAG TPA: hypothetical protein VNT01_00630 [Symbiobacteriaceae bacterium]|nr:hypothetical protein [Symbiobacteriaceae bacterium]